MKKKDRKLLDSLSFLRDNLKQDFSLNNEDLIKEIDKVISKTLKKENLKVK